MTRIFFTPSYKNHHPSGFSFFRILFGFILLISLPEESLASFTTETVDTSSGFSSMAVDKDGNLHVAYSDFKTGKLKYLKRTGSIWQTPQVIDPGSGAISRVSLVLDGLGNLHISYSYWTGTDFDLRYAKFDGTSWLVSTVESLEAGDIGTYPSIAVDVSCTAPPDFGQAFTCF